MSDRAVSPTALPKLLGRGLRLVWSSDRRRSGLLAALTILQSLAVLGQLALAGRLVGDVQRLSQGAGTFRDSLPEIVAFGALFALQGAAQVWMAETRSVLGEQTTRRAQGAISNAAARAPLVDFDRSEFHDLLTRAMRSAASRPLQITGSIATIASALALTVVLVITLAVIEPIVLLVLVIGGVPAWLLTRRVTRLGYRFALDETEPDRRRAYLLYLLTSRETAGEVRAFQLEHHTARRYQTLWDSRIAHVAKVARQRGIAGSASRIINSLAITAIIAVLVWTVANGQSDLSAAATAAGAVAILGQRLTALLSGIGLLYECGLFLSDVDRFAGMYPDRHLAVGTTSTPLDTGPADATVSPARGTLTASNVAFRYPTGSRNAVDGVNLEVSTGEMIALVGANGSGKTTLAKLLAGLYGPDSGSISWNGVSVEVDDVAWRNDVSVVFQDFAKFRLPLRENVGFGRVDEIDNLDLANQGDSDQLDAKIITALDTVGLGDLPASLPNGMQTGLGPQYANATDLSGGQWQRVAIARALFRDAPIVILDEPSAALDPDAEEELFTAIEQLCVGRAVVVVSHRLSTVARADRIYVASHGQITECGTHEELMARSGDYARMYQLQADRFTTPGQ